MANVPVEHGLVLAGALFLLGLTGVLVRRNLLFLLISIEVMLNAAALAFVVAETAWRSEEGALPDGQVMFVFVLTVSAAEVAVALALLVGIWERYRTLDGDAVSRMRG